MKSKHQNTLYAAAVARFGFINRKLIASTFRDALVAAAVGYRNIVMIADDFHRHSTCARVVVTTRPDVYFDERFDTDLAVS